MKVQPKVQCPDCGLWTTRVGQFYGTHGTCQRSLTPVIDTCQECGFRFTLGLTNDHSCEAERIMRARDAHERATHSLYHGDPNCHTSHSNSARCGVQS